MSQRILITSGPTREYLDPVRFLSNRSSGKMGAALAGAVLNLGYQAVVVSGPVQIEYPPGTEVHHVISTEEMLETSLKLFSDTIGAIAAAAPCDFRPLKFLNRKISKNELRTDGNRAELVLELTETPDIVASLVGKRTSQWIIAFALETDNHRENATAKLNRKACDLIVMNDQLALNAEKNDIEILDANGSVLLRFKGSKADVAEKILETVLNRIQC